MDGNLLSNETSPYLLQHRDNPVHWRPWGPAALDEAKRLRKPILLSVGYAACHWCHVMAHESFEDPETAAVMNRLFVNIKVDREERPDIDQIYMAALHALGEQGGWPLTMFLTPEAEPVWGGTYFPKTARYGRAAFVDVLNAIADSFANRPESIESNRAGLIDALSTPPALASGEPTAAMLDEASALVARLIDRRNGGLNGAPKFPQPTLMESLWRAYERSGRPEPRDLVLLTLRHILQGGIYDHLGGGIARYSVDDRWLVPHFEKMLYDNALLLERLSSAYRATGEMLFRLRIEETVGWLLREMRSGPAFTSSFDADSPGGEGAYYVWTPAELQAALGPERAVEFADIYDVTGEGNFEGHSILNRLSDLPLRDGETEARLAADREKLLAARARRQPPGRDDKILADWNGLAISGLVAAGVALDRDEWLAAARDAYRFVIDTMTVDGRLRHSYREGLLLAVGFASDYGAMMRAALALHAATGAATFVADAVRFADVLDRHYWDEGVAAYRLTADDTDALVTRPLPLHDESVPSANALIATGLAKLARLTGERRFAERVHRILSGHLGSARDTLGKAGLFNAFDEALWGTDIVIVAPTKDDAAEFRTIVHRHWREGFVLSVVSGGATVPPNHPAFGKGMQADRPTAYVCRGQICSLPVTAADALASMLSRSGPDGGPP
ncbi:MAG: thioredoxin domain-containing protein [Bauldia sp.]